MERKCHNCGNHDNYPEEFRCECPTCDGTGVIPEGQVVS